MGPLRIAPGNLDDESVRAFLAEHLEEMRAISPPDAAFALDTDALRTPGATFWTVHDGDTLVGCGALLEIDPSSGEIKSMRTVRAHRGRGIASRLLQHIVVTARDRGYTRLFLETGASEAFSPARSLYGAHGFTDCGPFAGYRPHPHSHFMTLELTPAPPSGGAHE